MVYCKKQERGVLMRRLMAMLLAVCVLLAGCVAENGPKKYEKAYFTAFDTYTTITGYAASQQEWDQVADALYDKLWQYHQLFDIYKEYDGINNLKTVNDHAGIAPVQVDGRIIALLLDCREFYEASGGLVNVAMGSVLRLWHDSRAAGLVDPENACLPDAAALTEAAKHTSWDGVIIDEEQATVYLADPAMSLDVGAVAKGWATQRVAEEAPSGVLLNVGGNICATGPKPDGDAWNVGVQDPDDSSRYLCSRKIETGSMVTSGDYQRFYTVEGTKYHHIIDPETGYPAIYWRSVTVVCANSGVADMLSTALFLLPLEEGKALLAKYGAEAIWVDVQGRMFQTDGFDG